MAELIVAGPAAIAVIQICDRIVGLCKHYIETVRDAPSDLKTILVEISFLKLTLENLSILASCSGNASDQSQGSHRLKDPIEECLRLVQKLERLFPSDTQQSSHNTSKRQRTKATFAQLAWPFKESKVRKLLESIRPLKETFILELTSQSLQDIREIKTINSKTQDVVTESQRQEVYKWLQHTDPSSLFYKAQQDYEPNTGTWVFRTPEWLDWKDSKSRCLWIHGIPGAGKTVLISHLVETIQKDCRKPEAEGCVCVYYFCFYGHKQDEGKPFLRWLINQLCRRSESVPLCVLSMYNYGGEPSLVDLLKALEEVLRDFETAYVVIDALDESLPRDDMLEVVRQIVKDARFQNLQLLASSRRYVDIQKTMEANSTPLSMDNDYVGADIRTYVHSAIRSKDKFKRFPTELLSDIEDAISRGAKGMFRWAVCQLDVLQRLQCDSDIIREYLQDLPETLKETYDRVLNLRSEEERFVVHCLFEWMRFYSDMYSRSVNPRQMPCQILAQVAKRCTSKPNGFESGLFYDEETIKELCGCLIKVFPQRLYDDWDRDHDVDFTRLVVDFAHYTVREYVDAGGLSRDPAGRLPTPEKALMQQPLKVIFEEALQLNLNTAGLQKIASPDPNSLLEAMFGDFNIFCTISALCALYCMGSEIAEEDDLSRLAFGLFDPFGAWFGSLCTFAKQMEDVLIAFTSRAYGEFWDVVFMKIGSPSAMQFVYLFTCFSADVDFPLLKRFVEIFGIRPLTQERLRFQEGTQYCENTDAYVSDGSIIEAAAQGFLFTRTAAFEQLLDLAKGSFDPSKVLRLYIGGSCYFWNERVSDTHVLTKLLGCGADPNTQNQRVTSLQIAVSRRAFSGVRTLLMAGADPNEAGSTAESPWEEHSVMAEYNQLFGASPLYICRNFGRLGSAGRICDDPKHIKAILFEHGAKSFLRPESALILRS